MRLTGNRAAAAALAVVAAIGAVLLWLLVLRAGERPDGAAAAYLRAWAKSDWAAMQRHVTEPPAGFRDANEEFFEGLGVEDARFSLRGVKEDGGRARARFTAQLRLGGLPAWTYEGALSLVRVDDAWLVDWSPRALHPAIRRGTRVEKTRRWPTRAAILGADGTPLAGPREVVVVGVEPKRIKNRRKLLAVLARHLGVDPGRVAAQLDRPGVRPDWFIPVAELRPERYEQLRPKIYPVPGTVFQRATARLRPSENFALHVLGDVGEVTAELLEEFGEPYASGDVVGLYGLERVFERELAGRPSGEVRLVDGEGSVVRVLERFEGGKPTPVRTTLDRDVQAAAETALAGVRKPAAIVALDVRSGEVRAAVSRPVTEFNRAFAARYAPGSTFKIVTAAALLENGVTPETTVQCPETTVVGGKPFRNAEGAALGPISFSTAFVESCNTAFVHLGARLGNRALVDAARRFGFGTRYEFPLDVAGGRFPAPRDPAERAAAAIGQARVEASPVHMAAVAAAAADGTWRAPVLLAGDPRPPSRALGPHAVRDLRELMRLVVTAGTGVEANVGGAPVMGKTGTAEYGSGQPLRAHAWFAGFRDNLAFAIVVEDGGFGGRVAAPLAGRFLAALGPAG